MSLVVQLHESAVDERLGDLVAAIVLEAGVPDEAQADAAHVVRDVLETAAAQVAHYLMTAQAAVRAQDQADRHLLGCRGCGAEAGRCTLWHCLQHTAWGLKSDVAWERRALRGIKP